VRFGSILWQILDFRAKQWIKVIIKCCHWVRTSNISLLYPKVCNNIGGYSHWRNPTKILGMCPRHHRRGWRQWGPCTTAQLRLNNIDLSSVPLSCHILLHLAAIHCSLSLCFNYFVLQLPVLVWIELGEMAGIFDEASAFDDGNNAVITKLCVLLSAT